MVIITLKTISSEKVGYHLLGDPIILVTTNSGSMYEIQNIEVVLNIFIRSSRDPRKKANDPQVENHWNNIHMASLETLGKIYPYDVIEVL